MFERSQSDPKEVKGVEDIPKDAETCQTGLQPCKSVHPVYSGVNTQILGSGGVNMV